LLEEKILEILADNFTDGFSINQLAGKLKEKGFSGDYKNTYNKIIELAGKKIIILKQTGKSRIILLNLKNQSTISILAKIEIDKKTALLQKRTELENMLGEFEKIDSFFIAAIDAEKNCKLNRIEFLILTDSPEKSLNELQKTAEKFSTRIDSLALNREEFSTLMRQGNQTLLQMLSSKIVLFGQENYWLEIRKTPIDGIRSKKIILLDSLNENEIRHNLAKFGYSEFGKEDANKELGLEETIIAALLTGSSRQKEAITTISSKNTFNPALLSFLAKKYGKESELLSLLTKKPIQSENAKKTIDILATLGTKNIRQKK
jgi:hypothetical protein